MTGACTIRGATVATFPAWSCADTVTNREESGAALLASIHRRIRGGFGRGNAKGAL
jgi:hypothetical protein